MRLTREQRKQQLIGRAVVVGIIILLLGVMYLAGMIAGGNADKQATTETVEMIESTEDVLRFEMEDVEVDIRSLGEYRITAYCGCSKCTDGDGLTALMKPPVEGRTVAVDPSVIPYGTVLVINGHEYIAEDSGIGWIEEKELDIYFESHEAAKEFGIQWAEVYVKEE